MRRPGALVIGGDYQGLGIIRSLGKYGIPIYLLDSGMCIGRVSKFTTKFRYCPSEEPLLLEFLLSLAREEKLDGCVVYPTTDEMIKFLSINKPLLESYYKIATPNWERTQILYNKKLTYKLASEINISIPETLYPKNERVIHELPLQFPVIIKPTIRGIFYKRTKKKAFLARDRKELLRAYKIALTFVPSSEIMIQEVIMGGASNLFSFCSFFKGGKALAKLVARRPRQHPMDFGRASTFAEIVDIPELEELGSRFLSRANYYGLSEAEFMWDPNDRCYKLLEVNARTWGWHTIGNQVGVNFLFLLYKDLTGQNIHFPAPLIRTQGKWVRILTDIPVGIREILGERLKLSEYIASLSGRKEYAVWSLRDPLPFFVEFLLLLYYWRKRGF